MKRHQAVRRIALRWTRRSALGFFLACAVLTTPESTHAESTGTKFDFYGFIRLDAIYDDSRFQHHQYAFWVLSEDRRVGIPNDSHFTLYPRVTRLGVRLNPAALSDRVSAKGVVEVDFQNGGTESRQILRMRLAYFELSSGNWQLLAGQAWDAIAPLCPGVHTDGVLWNAGNLGDRRPQARLTCFPSMGAARIELTAAAGLTGAVDNQDFDGNGRLDGGDAALPLVQGYVGAEHPGWFGSRAMVGIWAHYAEETIHSATADPGRRTSRVAGVSTLVPVLPRTAFHGEAWIGRNLSDLRGGIGQGLNLLTGEEISARGGWVQLAIEATSRWQAFLGTSVDDPDDDDVPSLADVTDAELGAETVGRTLNWTAFLSNRYRPYKALQVGLEYVYWVTEYRGLDRGDAHRVNLHFSYLF